MTMDAALGGNCNLGKKKMIVIILSLWLPVTIGSYIKSILSLNAELS